MLAKSQWLDVAGIVVGAKKGIGLCDKAIDCLLLSLQLYYLCIEIAIPKWKTTAADALTLVNLVYPSVSSTSLTQQKMQSFAIATSAAFALLTEKSSFQNDQERSQILRKYSFAWGFAATYQWLGYDIVCLDFFLVLRNYVLNLSF